VALAMPIVVFLSAWIVKITKENKAV